MPYNSGTKLPGESASKLGHLSVIKSEWVKSLIVDFEAFNSKTEDDSKTPWEEVRLENVEPLKHVWAVDGSFVSVKADGKPQREVAFVKTAILSIDKTKLEAIDPENPHPVLMKDLMAESALFHATAFPLRNVRTSKGTNKDAIRNIVFDSIRIDQDGEYFQTLKWLAYKKWKGKGKGSRSPAFDCPHCNTEIKEGIDFDLDESTCPNLECKKQIFLTDMIGFHLDMSEDSAPDSVASSYMLIMEHLMLFTIIRLFWENRDKKLVSETLFIKDGPLTLRSQYSKLVPNIREFLHYAKLAERPVHVIGQEKSGTFYDHLTAIAKFGPPKTADENASFAVLSHEYVRNEVYRAPDLTNPYGKRTNWGEKVYYKHDPGTYMVLNIPTGKYKDDNDFPKAENLIGLDRILATIPELISRKYEGAIYPIELANGIASMSSYPSAKILERFLSSRVEE